MKRRKRIFEMETSLVIKLRLFMVEDGGYEIDLWHRSSSTWSVWKEVSGLEEAMEIVDDQIHESIMIGSFK